MGALSLAASLHAEAPNPDSAADVQFFEKKVRPILVEHCYACHAADTKPSGGLRVDDRNGLLMGGDGGPAVVSGDPEHSLLLQRIHIDDKKRHMPKEGDPLTESEIADLTTWIKNGVAWPRERIPASLGKTRADYEQLRSQHWAWQPLSPAAPPLVKDDAWARSNVDRFILAKLEAAHLAPVADVDRVTLIRRIAFDLTGLPPTPEEIGAFLNDTTPQAFARVVDRLLASPQFGERWGRHWLDVARYGESTGPSRNIPYPHAWRYRDYVIDAVNRDVPFDQFVQEQIAGDLLQASSSGERDRLLTATGFLALGVKDVNQRFKTRFIMDNVDEQIDTVTRSVLGLTASCARCHDHKFDPISVTDYYALAGIFTSTEDCAGVRNKMGGSGLAYYDPKNLVTLSTEAPTAPQEEIERLEAEVTQAKEAFAAIKGTPEGTAKGPDGKPKQRALRLKAEALEAKLLALTDPAHRGVAVHGVREGKTIADTEVRIRGEAERLGPTVPRGFLSVLRVPDAPTIQPEHSGRLELAQWLTSSQNPLTPRVIVNRVWAQLFGQGLVNTVDNFGVKGDIPSHPELLDYLARQFMQDGWSLKKLVRSLALTHTYQLGSEAPPSYHEIDPANRLVWRHTSRRLDAEEMRDAMLASSGRLMARPQEGSPVKELRMVEMRDNGPEARQINTKADGALFRSVYLPLLRGVTPKALEAFDPVSQTLVTGQRDATTVPTQALYLLNSTFVRQQSLALAERVAADRERFDAERLQQLYALILGREPSAEEAARDGAFLTQYANLYRLENPSPASVAHEPLLAENSHSETSETGGAAATVDAAANPDDVDRSDPVAKEPGIEPRTPQIAAWMSLIQSLYASAEFRFVR